MTSYDIEPEEYTQRERILGRALAAAFTVAVWCLVIRFIVG